MTQAQQSDRLLTAAQRYFPESWGDATEELAAAAIQPMALEILLMTPSAHQAAILSFLLNSTAGAELGAPDDAGAAELEEASRRCADECARRLALMSDEQILALVAEAVAR